jgi:hypothetical protein
VSISLLDGSLQIDIYFDPQDCRYDDNICVQIKEDCPEEEKIFHAGETNIFLTAEQARQLASLLTKIADQSNHATR